MRSVERGLVRSDMAFAALAAVDIAAAAVGTRGAARVRRLTKPLLMPTLAAGLTATRSTAEAPRSLRRHALVGLGLSAVGDVALLRDDDRSFLVGLGAFLGAHAAYARGFLLTGGRAEPAHRARRVLPAAAALAVASPVLARTAGPMRGPALAYAAAITGMLGAALTLDDELPDRAASRIRWGAALFVLSDSLIAVRRFVLPQRAGRPLDAAVMATYTTGQWLIADGVRRACRTGRRAG